MPTAGSSMLMMLMAISFTTIGISGIINVASIRQYMINFDGNVHGSCARHRTKLLEFMLPFCAEVSHGLGLGFRISVVEPCVKPFRCLDSKHLHSWTRWA